jgi:hypothetical protein
MNLAKNFVVSASWGFSAFGEALKSPLPQGISIYTSLEHRHSGRDCRNPEAKDGNV